MTNIFRHMTKVLSAVAMGTALVFAASAASAQSDQGTVLAEGEWVKSTANIRGEWSIVERDGTRYIEFDDEFRTRNAPDLKVFLSPTEVGDLTNNNAIEGSQLVSVLESNRGAQSYELPADVDLSSYESVIIHCEAYTKLWGGGAL